MTTNDKLHQTCLALLELVVLIIYVVGRMIDLSFLGLWEYWLAMMFFWLLVLLLVASIKIYSKHRRLAVAGLCLMAMIIVPAFFTSL